MSNPINGSNQRSLDVSIDGTLFADNLYVPVDPTWSVVYKFPVTADADGIDIAFGVGGEHDGNPWVTAIAATVAGPVRHEVGGDGVLAAELLSAIQGNEVTTPGVDDARVIRVIQNKPTSPNSLMLNEVQAIETGTGTNVALSGSADQSTQLSNFGPELAIDNNLNNFTHTNDGQGEWWKVELAADADLDKLTIYSRNGCCGQNRTGDIQVQVFSDVGLTNMLFDERVLGIGTSDVRDVPLSSLTSADLTASLNPHDMGAGYTYVFELGGDMLSVANPDPNIFTTYLDLNGAALEAEWADGNPPAGLALGDTFQLLDADVIQGMYDSLVLPELPGFMNWNTDTFLTNGTLTVAPEPSTFALAAFGLLGLGWFGRRRRR